jgi:adenylate cyclase
MGIGINRGEVVVGNIGSEKRVKYSAIGSAINTAYRIESYTVGGQILLSPGLYERLEPILKTRGTVEARFKGIDQPVTLHDVVAIEGEYPVSLPEKEPENLISLEPPMAVSCFTLEGKSVSDESIPGRIIRLGESAAELLLPEPVEVRSNLKILVDTKESAPLPEIYAKVLTLDESGASPEEVKAGIEFTWVPEEVKALFDERRSAGQPPEGQE